MCPAWFVRVRNDDDLALFEVLSVLTSPFACATHITGSDTTKGPQSIYVFFAFDNKSLAASIRFQQIWQSVQHTWGIAQGPYPATCAPTPRTPLLEILWCIANTLVEHLSTAVAVVILSNNVLPVLGFLFRPQAARLEFCNDLIL